MGEVARLFEEPVQEQASATEPEALRIAEALVFAAAEPLDEATIASRLPDGSDVSAVMAELQRTYAGRGVNLVRVARKWTFRTAADLSWLLAREDKEQKKLSRAAIETLAIIAYHQPVTRADIEEIRGVAVSKGALDVLMETGWIRLRGRRKAPGRPITYGTTTEFLVHFGLEAIGDLPGLDELKGAGLFEGRLPPGFGVPSPTDDPALAEDEEPLEETAAVVEAYGPQSDEEEPVEAEADAAVEKAEAQGSGEPEASAEAERGDAETGMAAEQADAEENGEPDTIVEAEQGDDDEEDADGDED